MALASALAAQPALAQQAPSNETPDDDAILVVGQRDAPITVVPRGLSVSLGAEEFGAINAINVEDLMKYAPNFYVRKRFAGDDNAVVALRGANTIQSARTIVLVDGFVVSNFLGNRWDYPPKWNVVGPSEVRQFDIVYGPYSARYGGNSMGGVISVTTQELEGTSVNGSVQGFAMPFREYGYDYTFTGYSAEGSAGWKQRDGPWSVRGGIRHFENIGQAQTYNLLSRATGDAPSVPVTGAYVDERLAAPVFGGASPVDVVQDQGRLRIGYETRGGWKLEALGFVWKTRQELTDPRSFLTDAAGDPVYQGRVLFAGEQWNATGLNFSTTSRTEYLVGAKLAGPIAGWDVSANLSRYWIPEQDSRTSANYLAGESGGAGTQTVQDVPGWWTGDIAAEHEIGAHKLALGVNANLYATAQETFATANWRSASAPVFTAATRGKTSLWGIWVEDAWLIGPDVTLTGGIRYDRWRAFGGGLSGLVACVREDERYAERTDDSISPKLSIQGELPGAIAAQLSFGTATRFPTVGELFQGRFDTDLGIIDPDSFDPDLRPEKSRDVNLILARNFGKLRTTASIFYQDVEDAIFSFQGLNQFGTVVSSYKNVDRTRQVGVELIGEIRDLLPRLDVDANVAWTDARTLRNTPDPRAEGVQFPRIPRWRANGNIRYQIADPVKLSAGWRFATRPNSDLLGQVRGGAYGFQTEYFFIDTRASVALSETLDLSVGIDNLFNDQAYVSHPLPQRTFVADIKAKW
ncbi:TonB-dependent receptor [Sphingomonas japonica]|uniref:Iron complex outermembrane receptor protein n=1 Tax=Sphingomonas japonica TaxID=511662 RepID=A0ABX0U3J2_9SPHN|nr:TonB-dependent receptor [Sphingomonas japonica]NIJ24610.1 iron complex outermembrane receptor protein [Sphingomonas japonica]